MNRPSLARRVAAKSRKLFIDPFNQSTRDSILLAAEISKATKRIIDIGCGTGALASFLESQDPDRSVDGIDFDPGNIWAASQRSLNGKFEVADATDLPHIANKEYDLATLSLILHSLSSQSALQVLREAARIATKLVIADFSCPQPDNFAAEINRFSELRAGQQHYQNFQEYLARGGISYLLQEADLRLVFETRATHGTVQTVLAAPK